MKLIIKGADRVAHSINNAPRITKKGIRQGMYFVGRELRNEANRAILEKPKHGRTYIIRRGGRRFRHVASAPGETFANQTGAARRTLGWSVRGDRLEFGFRANADTAYVKPLELGRLNRPALKNAIRAKQRDVEVILRRELEKALESA